MHEITRETYLIINHQKLPIEISLDFRDFDSIIGVMTMIRYFNTLMRWS